MRVIKADLQMLTRRILLIGFVGENERTQVRIDAGAVFAEYPDSFPALVIKPPVGDTYPVVVSIEGNDVVWEVLNTDLTFDGEGELQLMFVVDDVVVKTVIGTFKVNRSIIVPGTTPTPVESWVQQATLKLGDVDRAINSLEQSDATAEGLPAGSAPTVDLVDFDGHKRFEFGIPKGDKGDTYELTQADREEIAEIAEENFTTEVKGYRDDAVAAKNRSEEILTAVSGSTAQAASSAAEAGRQAQAAALSAQAASSSATAADGSARTASEKASEANASAQNASGSASTATQKAAAAAQSATDAAQSAQAAESARDTAQSTVAGAIAGIQAEGQTQIGAVQAEGRTQVGNVNSAGTTQVGAVQAKGTEVLNSIPEDYTELTEQVAENTEALTTKAEIDGYYSDMTVGDAEQLVSSKFVEDKALYSFRTSGGTKDIGNREYLDKIVGGTVCWNQLVPVNSSNRSKNENGVTITDNRDGSYTVSTDANGATATVYTAFQMSDSFVKDHVYLYYSGVPETGNLRSYIIGGNIVDDGKPFDKGSFHKGLSTSSFNVVPAYILSGAVISTAVTIKPQLFDLTQMFGSAIADYIYSLDANVGVAWFKKLFPKDYYEYNPGELVSVKALSHDTVGFNQWDEEWELGAYNQSTGAGTASSNTIRSKNKIDIIGGAKYCARSGLYSFWYDASDNFIEYIYYSGTSSGWNVVTAPENARYMRFYVYGTTYNNNICINLSWSGTHDGEYQPYEKHSYDMNGVELRGMVRLDENNELVYDGDEYTADGTVTRKYGIVDLGTMAWVKYNANNGNAFVANVPGAMPRNNAFVTNIICTKYAEDTSQSNAYYIADGTCKFGGSYFGTSKISIVDSAYTDATAFKTAMSGVYLLYELATPTTEQADPYNKIQLIDDWGTEEFVTETVLPVWAEARYPANLRDKLQHLPDMAEEDGKYVIQQTGTQMELVPAGLGHKADIDGTYDDMTVGAAKQLISSDLSIDQVPYNYRTSGGSLDIGNRKNESVVGGTLGWNQLVQNGNFADGRNGWSFNNCTPSVSNGKVTISVTSGKKGVNYGLDSANAIKQVVGHKYLYGFNIKVSDVSLGTAQYNVTGTYYPSVSLVSGVDKRVEGIVSATAESIRMFVYPWGTNSVTLTGNETIEAHDYVMFDLTQMLGSTVADYVYQLENTTAGAGVAWLKRFIIKKDYYPYHKASLESVNVSAHEVVGFNMWDEELESGNIDTATGENKPNANTTRSKNYIPVIPSTNYHMLLPWAHIFFYNANKEYIAYVGNGVAEDGAVHGKVIATPANAYYMRFRNSGTYGTTYKGDICINLSWSGWRNGTYEPYVKHTYPLDSSLTLRGILKLDANNEPYFDGDEYKPNGTVTRRYKEDEITLTGLYTNPNNSAVKFALFNLSDKWSTLRESVNDKNMIPSTTGWAAIDTVGTILSYDSVNSIVAVAISNDTTLEQAKSAYDGGHLLYKLATPTTETAESYQTPMVVDDFGTERFVDYAYEQGERDVEIPCGHYTEYQANLRDKLQHLPSLADADGYYMVQQNGRGMSLVLFRIPQASGLANGTYTLKATVTNGTPVYTWEAVT